MDLISNDKAITSKTSALLGWISFSILYAVSLYIQVNHIAASFLKALVGYFLSWIVVNGFYSLRKVKQSQEMDGQKTDLGS